MDCGAACPEDAVGVVFVEAKDRDERSPGLQCQLDESESLLQVDGVLVGFDVEGFRRTPRDLHTHHAVARRTKRVCV